MQRIRGSVSLASSPGFGFTIIELLVVVSVISLLLAILLPALGGARQRARQLICLSHQRQLGVGMVMYSDDHNNHIPFLFDDMTPGLSTDQRYFNLGGWAVLMGDALGWQGEPSGGGEHPLRTTVATFSIIHCPQEPNYNTPTDPPALVNPPADWAIPQFAPPIAAANWRLDRIARPSEKVFLVDTPRGFNHWNQWLRFPVDLWPYELTRMRHAESINNLHFDGHADNISRDGFEIRGIHAMLPQE